MTITEADSNTLMVTSNAFKDGQYMPVDYTGFGKDMSPDFRLHNLSKKAVSIAIIMDDLDIPFLPAYNHWLIWNIPAMQEIPEKIPHGPEMPDRGLLMAKTNTAGRNSRFLSEICTGTYSVFMCWTVFWI